jgi:hypothetical protein
MCLPGSMPLQWVSAPARWMGRRHVLSAKGASVGGGRSTAMGALRIMPLTFREACRKYCRSSRRRCSGKEADLGTGRVGWTLSGVTAPNFSPSPPTTSSSRLKLLSPLYTFLSISQHTWNNVSKNDPPRLKTTGCPPNTALCATTSTSRHHTSNSHTRPMVLRCCASKCARGSREERGGGARSKG